MVFSDPSDFLKESSSHSICTMETDTDVTYQSSSSSNMLLGASLDLDRHSARTNHHRTNQRGYLRGGDSQDGFGESFMLDESFALGEPFSCYEDGGGLSETTRRQVTAMRERPDLSSVLVIEEDGEDNVHELDKEEERKIYELERQAQKLTLKPQTSNISVDAREG
jgi:hypothetical protein